MLVLQSLDVTSALHLWALQHAFSLTEPILCFSKELFRAVWNSDLLRFASSLFCLSSFPQQVDVEKWVCLPFYARKASASSDNPVHLPVIFQAIFCVRDEQHVPSYPQTDTHTKQQHPILSHTRIQSVSLRCVTHGASKRNWIYCALDSSHRLSSFAYTVYIIQNKRVWRKRLRPVKLHCSSAMFRNKYYHTRS